ncbi:inverse autotransporter beta domain-containing protein [Xenorhabdus ishibashii]|nr:inverse autotransporter beta domain-containing protein [Xenorhabdus ishibashii]
MNGSDKQYLNSDTHKKNSVKENNHTSNADTQYFIAKNLQMAGSLLSSSPSELAEKAKSYAVGQVNGLVTSEAQKWLSQFGTARINFGLDKKGSRKNSSIELLLPLYDNKADWLFFSQLGYRNKDSRDTINLGLGGRYFYQDWMYGLNTFYDNDLTDKNQRLGLGGEMWADNIKLAANTYFRVSNWKNSRDFVGYYERPANGFDISGEFFLPAYPNLGAKLTYEQYFGDEVTLFDRDTKQKNPVLATLGLSYTPVPLFTLGVDYKQGNGHNETQFLANLSYRLGVPLSVQLSPENVATARTLAGSRYDLVERNNHIVLEHQAKPAAQLSLPEVITGYSGSQQDITAKFSSESPLKQIHWATNKDFEQHGGKLSSKTGNTINVTLPTYLSGDNQNNNYPIYAVAEWENNQKSAPAEMRVIVRPFMLKKQEGANFTPAGPLPATGDQKDGYTFDPVITFDTAANAPIKNVTINHVQWITDPKIGPENGLKLLDWGTSDSVVLDENGRFKQKPVLVSTQPYKDVKVYLQIDSQPPELVGEVSFGENLASFHVNKVEVSPAVPSLIANGSQAYTYSAVVLDGNNNPVKNQKIANVTWKITQNGKEVSITDPDIKFTTNGDTTTTDGELTAKLSSKKEMKDVIVSLSIEGHSAVSAQTKVTFTTDTQDYSIDQAGITSEKLKSLSADNYQQYQFMATILGVDGKPVKEGSVISDAHWKIDKPSDASKNGIILIPDTKTDSKGNLKAIITSTKAYTGDVVVSLQLGKHKPVQSPTYTVDFGPAEISPIISDLPGPIAVNSTYNLTVTVTDSEGNPLHNKTVNWHTKIDNTDNPSAVKISPSSTTNPSGKATTTLTSYTAQDVIVTASVDGIGTTQPLTMHFAWPKISNPVRTGQNPPVGKIKADGQQYYIYTATITGPDGKLFKNALKGTLGYVPINWSSTGKLVTFAPIEDAEKTPGKLQVHVKSAVAENIQVCVAIDTKEKVEPISSCSETGQQADFN